MQPTWLDRDAYPFATQQIAVAGGCMSYVDEGEGAPIVFVHGTPVWSFLYRHLIRDLARDYRCIAPDHLGFGLSEKPAGWGYGIADHARNLGALIERLDLREITLVVHDLGGPIGLSYATEHPERIKRLVIANTLMWPMDGEFAAPPVAKLFGGPGGRLFYLGLNGSARWLLPLVYGDRSKLTPAIHQHYIAPFPQPADRHGMFAFARLIAGGAAELSGLWERRARIGAKPALLIWGLKDPAFGPRFLERWRQLLPQATLLTLPAAGHFVQEEEPEAVIAAIRNFMT